MAPLGLGSPDGHCHRQKPWEAEQRALTEGHLLPATGKNGPKIAG